MILIKSEIITVWKLFCDHNVLWTTLYSNAVEINVWLAKSAHSKLMMTPACTGLPVIIVHNVHIIQLNLMRCNFAFILKCVMFGRFDLIRTLLLSIFHWMCPAHSTLFIDSFKIRSESIQLSCSNKSFREHNIDVNIVLLAHVTRQYAIISVLSLSMSHHFSIRASSIQ